MLAHEERPSIDCIGDRGAQEETGLLEPQNEDMKSEALNNGGGSLHSFSVS